VKGETESVWGELGLGFSPEKTHYVCSRWEKGTGRKKKKLGGKVRLNSGGRLRSATSLVQRSRWKPTWGRRAVKDLIRGGEKGNEKTGAHTEKGVLRSQSKT